MSTLTTSKQYCSQISTQAGERLPGTATRTQVFFLLEYPGAWGEKAFDDSALPQPVKSYLAAQAQAIQDARILLIRGDPGSIEVVHFFLALVAEGEEALFEFQLPDYESLLSLDIADLIADPDHYLEFRRAAPLYLVCAHGRRDACCARFGLPVYQALRMQYGEMVWQCSHVGGHRFAANLLCLPSGLLYGRVGSDIATSIARAMLDGRISAENYRGRVSYPPPAQAAEYALRETLGQTGLHAFRLFSVDQTEPGRWRVRFLERGTRQTHQLILLAEPKDIQVFDSCRMEKAVAVVEYRLVEFRSFDAASGVA